MLPPTPLSLFLLLVACLPPFISASSSSSCSCVAPDCKTTTLYSAQPLLIRPQLPCTPYSLATIKSMTITSPNKSNFTVWTRNIVENPVYAYPSGSTDNAVTSCFEESTWSTESYVVVASSNLVETLVTCYSDVCEIAHDVQFGCVDDPATDNPSDPGVDGVEDGDFEYWDEKNNTEGDEETDDYERITRSGAAKMILGVVGLTFIFSLCFYGLCKYEHEQIKNVQHGDLTALHNLAIKREKEMEIEALERERGAYNEGAVELRSPAMDMREI